MQIIGAVLVYGMIIPICVGILVYKKLDYFAKLILLSIIIALIVEPIAKYYAFVYRNNDLPYFIYDLFHSFILVAAWLQLKEFRKDGRLTLKVLLLVSLILMILSYLLDLNGLISSSINLLLGLILGLFYYYKKLMQEEMTESLIEPVFIFSSAYILFCISMLVFYVGYVIVEDADAVKIWAYKQVFFLIYNLILTYGFFLYSNIKKV